MGSEVEHSIEPERDHLFNLMAESEELRDELAEKIHAQSHSENGSAVMAEELLNNALNDPTEKPPSLISFNSALNAAAKCEDGSVMIAERIFTSIKDNGLEPNHITYHSLLDAHAHNDGGSACRGLSLLEEMLDRNIRVELSTFTIVLTMQGRLDDGSARAALKILSMIPQTGLRPNTIVVNAAIDAQAKASDGSATTVVALIKKMAASPDLDLRPSIITYTAAIDACAKCSDGTAEIAATLLQQMVEQGLAPNSLTFGVLVAVAARKGTANAASDIIAKMRNMGVTTNIVAFNSALDAQAKRDGGSAAQARELLAEMKRSSDPDLRPNIVSYTAAIAAEARCEDGSADHAAALFDEALSMGLSPDIVTLTTLLDTLAKKGSNAVRAVEILERMREVNILSPNRIHYNVVINACATSRPALVNEAARVLSMMLESNISPTAHTLSALLRAAAFAAQPRPDLARRWFCEYRHQVEVNDFVIRALRSALPTQEANALLEDSKNQSSSLAPDFFNLLSKPLLSTSSQSLTMDTTLPTPGASSGSSGDECEPSESPPMVRRRSSRLSFSKGRSSPNMTSPGAMFVPPSDRPVSSNSRRGSFSNRRRGSMSGIFAESTNAVSPSPDLYAALGATVRRGSSGLLQLDLKTQERSNTSPPPLPRRMSLKDRVAALRRESSISVTSNEPSNKNSSINNTRNSDVESIQESDTADPILLTPDFFQPKTPPESPTLQRRDSTILRRPSGPDGSLGFGSRRTSTVLSS